MKKLLVLLMVISVAVTGYGQPQNRYEADINILKSFDRSYPPNPNPIVFTGSSSIRLWSHLPIAFGNLNVINRGIGGAVLNDIIYNLEDLVFKYSPRQIVLFVGENDIPDANTTADTILRKTKQLFGAIRARLPQVPILYIAMKPSPSREQYRQKCQEGNLLVKAFLATQQNVKFIDVFSLMLKDDKCRPELFTADMLHMNAAGYAIWEKAIKKELLEYKQP